MRDGMHSSPFCVGLGLCTGSVHNLGAHLLASVMISTIRCVCVVCVCVCVCACVRVCVCVL